MWPVKLCMVWPLETFLWQFPSVLTMLLPLPLVLPKPLKSGPTTELAVPFAGNASLQRDLCMTDSLSLKTQLKCHVSLEVVPDWPQSHSLPQAPVHHSTGYHLLGMHSLAVFPLGAQQQAQSTQLLAQGISESGNELLDGWLDSEMHGLDCFPFKMETA